MTIHTMFTFKQTKKSVIKKQISVTNWHIENTRIIHTGLYTSHQNMKMFRSFT